MKKASNRSNGQSWIQKKIDAVKVGAEFTTKELFPELWAKYDAMVHDSQSKKEATQKKRNFGRAFTTAVKNGEYKNIISIGKNKQKSSLFRRV